MKKLYDVVSKATKINRITGLKEVVTMGFSREKALRDIDASLDEELGAENRKPLMEEEISDQLYEDILFGFRCEAEENGWI